MIWGYIVLAYFSLFALGLSDNIRGPLYPEILKAFQISDTQGAAFWGITSLLGFCGSFLVRFLLRHWSRIQTLQFASALMSSALFGMAWAPNFSWLLICAAVFGLSLGLVGVVQNVLVNLGSTQARRQQMLSGLHSTYGIASLLAPMTVAAMAAVFHSWRASFIAAGTIAALVFVGSLFAKNLHNTKAQTSARPLMTSHFFHHAGQTYVAFAMSLYVLVEILVASRLALYIRRDFAFDLTQSTYYVTLFFVCLLLGRLVFTFFHFRFATRTILSASLVASFIVIVIGISGYPLFLVLSGLTMAPFYPLCMAYISEHFKATLDSAISTTLAMAYIMTVVMHGLVGYLTDLYGISKALWVGPAALVLAFAVLNSFESLFRKKL